MKQESNRQNTMEDIDYGWGGRGWRRGRGRGEGGGGYILLPALDGQSLGER